MPLPVRINLSPITFLFDFISMEQLFLAFYIQYTSRCNFLEDHGYCQLSASDKIEDPAIKRIMVLFMDYVVDYVDVIALLPI